MKVLTKKYLIFFIVVLIVSPLIGMFLYNEEFNAIFAARAFFTACISTLIYFVINRRSEKRA